MEGYIVACLGWFNIILHYVGLERSSITGIPELLAISFPSGIISMNTVPFKKAKYQNEQNETIQ